MNGTETRKQLDCKAAEAAMADLLLDPGAAPPAARAHLAACARCRGELEALGSTAALMDGWTVPEPSPFWQTRMTARLKEEQAAPARGLSLTGWVQMLRTRAWVSNRALRPSAAGVGALAVVLAVGGGTWVNLSHDLSHDSRPAAVQASNAVHDLQSLDENAQVFQELSSLDEPDAAQAN